VGALMNQRWDPHYVREDGRASMAEIWAKEEAEQRAKEARMIEDAKADARAVWALADHLMPPDVVEMGRALALEEVLKEAWRNAFIAGWRAAHRPVDNQRAPLA
jgi:hypothetical protein